VMSAAPVSAQAMMVLSDISDSQIPARQRFASGDRSE
jgi:hypothetical protein